MKQFAFLAFAFILFTSFSTPEEICLKPEEAKLYELLMKYRKQKNLPTIPLSYSLTKVAKMHTYDLYTNNPETAKCNMHSWSKMGSWTACCYTSNHAQAECMWNKPRELTEYKGDGFEIAARLVGSATAEQAMEGWKKSTGHNQVMINAGTWKRLEWNAVGIGITGKYAVIWFGSETDPDERMLLVCE